MHGKFNQFFPKDTPSEGGSRLSHRVGQRINRWLWKIIPSSKYPKLGKLGVVRGFASQEAEGLQAEAQGEQDGNETKDAETTDLLTST